MRTALKATAAALAASLCLVSCDGTFKPVVVENSDNGRSVLADLGIAATTYAAIKDKPSRLAKFQSVSAALGELSVKQALSLSELEAYVLKAAGGDARVYAALELVLAAYGDSEINLETYAACIAALKAGIDKGVNTYLVVNGDN